MSLERTIEITRASGDGFGFSVIGGCDTILPPMVCALVQDGPASESGELLVGDVIVRVNGLEVGALPTKKVVDLIRNSPDRIVLAVKEDKSARARAKPFLSENTVTDAPKERVLKAKVRRNTSSPGLIESQKSKGSPPRPTRNVGSPNYDRLGTDGRFTFKGSFNRDGDKLTSSDGHYSDPDDRVYNRRPNRGEYYTQSYRDGYHRHNHYDTEGGSQFRGGSIDPPSSIDRGHSEFLNPSQGYPEYITSSPRSQGCVRRDYSDPTDNYNDLLSQISGHVGRRHQSNNQQSTIHRNTSNEEKLALLGSDTTGYYSDPHRTEMGRKDTYTSRQGSQSEEKLDYRYFNGTNADSQKYTYRQERVVGRGTLGIGSRGVKSEELLAGDYTDVRTSSDQSQSYKSVVPNIITSGNGYKNYYSEEMLETSISRNQPTLSCRNTVHNVGYRQTTLSEFSSNRSTVQVKGNNRSGTIRSGDSSAAPAGSSNRNRTTSSPTRRNVMYESYIGGQSRSPPKTVAGNSTKANSLSDNIQRQGMSERKRNVTVTRSNSLGNADTTTSKSIYGREDPKSDYLVSTDYNLHRSSSCGKGSIKMNGPVSTAGLVTRDRNSFGDEPASLVITGSYKHNSTGDVQNAILSRSDVVDSRFDNLTVYPEQRYRASSDLESDLGSMLRDISPDRSMVRGSEARNSFGRDSSAFEGSEHTDGCYSSKFSLKSNTDSAQYSDYSGVSQTRVFNVPDTPSGSISLNEPNYYRPKVDTLSLVKDGLLSEKTTSDQTKQTKLNNRNDNRTLSKDALLKGTEISAADLATRLFTLDGFSQEEVAPLMGKNTEFSQEVCREYLKYFNFQGLTLDDSVREFLNKFPLTGETQERERILVHFSKRYYECNHPDYGSEDAIHTLTCAMMLLNTDLHGQNIGTKMTLNEFINNLSGLCDGGNFPKEILKTFYQSIKNRELVWTGMLQPKELKPSPKLRKSSSGGNPFVEIKADDDAVVMKKGMMYRKCLMDSDGRRTPAIKRGWKMFHCVLKGLVLFLHKPDRSEPEQFQTIGIHHSLAGFAAEYKKRPFVFKLITADWRVFMFQAKNKMDVQDWVDALNLSAAALSSPPLPAPVSSSKRFQKQVMPVTTTRLGLDDQIKRHQDKVETLGKDLEEHRDLPRGEISKDNKEWENKMDYLEFEHKRFTSYVNVLTVPRLHEKLQFLLANKNNDRKTVNAGNHVEADGPIKKSNSMSNLIGPSSSPDVRRRVRESYFMAVNS